MNQSIFPVIALGIFIAFAFILVTKSIIRKLKKSGSQNAGSTVMQNKVNAAGENAAKFDNIAETPQTRKDILQFDKQTNEAIKNGDLALIFEPFTGLGPIKFGTSRNVAEKLQAVIPGLNRCEYNKDNLDAFSIDPEKAESIFFAGQDLLKMDKLEAALYLAKHSKKYGQAQGGSLYFMDLGCAILQFESPMRSFVFFAREFNTGEPLCEMSPESIQLYYEEQMSYQMNGN